MPGHQEAETSGGHLVSTTYAKFIHAIRIISLCSEGSKSPTEVVEDATVKVEARGCSSMRAAGEKKREGLQMSYVVEGEKKYKARGYGDIFSRIIYPHLEEKEQHERGLGGIWSADPFTLSRRTCHSTSMAPPCPLAPQF